MLEIVYQDEYLVAVNKPAGMLVHRSWLDKHETEFVMQTLRDQIGGERGECSSVGAFSLAHIRSMSNLPIYTCTTEDRLISLGRRTIQASTVTRVLLPFRLPSSTGL